MEKKLTDYALAKLVENAATHEKVYSSGVRLALAELIALREENKQLRMQLDGCTIRRTTQ